MFEFTKNGNFKSVFLEIITVPYKAIWFLLVDSREYLALRPQNRAIRPSPGADGHGNNARGQPTHAPCQGETSIVRHRSWCRITALGWGTSGWEIHKIPDENWEKLPNFFRIWPKKMPKNMPNKYAWITCVSRRFTQFPHILHGNPPWISCLSAPGWPRRFGWEGWDDGKGWFSQFIREMIVIWDLWSENELMSEWLW